MPNDGDERLYRERSETTISDAYEVRAASTLNPVARRLEREEREKQRKQTNKRLYESKWERRVANWMGRIQDRITHRKRDVVYMDPAGGTLTVGDQKFGGKAFNYFTVQHWLRRGAVMLLTDRWYQKLVVFFLMVHSISVLSQGNDDADNLNTSAILDAMGIIDRLLLIFFALELVVVMLAYRVKKVFKSIFRLLDITVVVVGLLIDFLPPDSPAVPVLFALNALRPLRIINRVAGMRKLMNVVVSCAATMAGVGWLVLVLLFIFSNAGVILFADSLHARCKNNLGAYGNVCTQTVSSIEFLNMPCPIDFNCTADSPVPSRWANFDTVYYGILSVLQVMTLDDWMVVGGDVMNGWSPFAFFFFFVLTIVGSFWAVNLMLAVITDAFSRFFNEEQMEREALQASAAAGKPIEPTRAAISKALAGDEKMSQARVVEAVQTGDLKTQFLKDDKDALSSSSGESVDTDNSLVRARIEGSNPLVRQQWNQWLRILTKQAHTSLVHGLETMDFADEVGETFSVSDSDEVRHISEHRSEVGNSTARGFDDSDIVAVAVLSHQSKTVVPESKALKRLKAEAEVERRVRFIEHWIDEMPDEFDAVSDDGKAAPDEDEKYDPLLVVPEASYRIGTPGRVFSGEAAKKSLLFDRYNTAAVAIDGEDDDDQPMLTEEERRAQLELKVLGRRKYLGHRARVRQWVLGLKEKMYNLAMQLTDELAENARDVQSTPWKQIVERIHHSPKFSNFMRWIININCAVLMLVHFGMPNALSVTVDVVCSIVDVIVVLDFGCSYYFNGAKMFRRRLNKDVFGLFEGFVAVLCFLDLVLAETRLVPFLRIFRIMRALKNFRYFTTLHWIIDLIRSSLHYLINLMLLLVMFSLVFAILGRHVFGNSVQEPRSCSSAVMPLDCNSMFDCVWVNATEWAEIGDYIAFKQEAVYPNITYQEMLVFDASNATGMENTTIQRFIEGYGNYSCRQFQSWADFSAVNRLTFTSIGASLLTIFNYLTRDNWSAVMYNFMDANPFAALYFLPVLLLGGYVLLSLLVAILLVNFGKIDMGEGANVAEETVAEAEAAVDSHQARRDTPPQPEPAMEAKLEDARRANLKLHGGVIPQDEGPLQDVDASSDAPRTLRTRLSRLAVRFLRWFCDEADQVVDPTFFQGRSYFLFSPTNKARIAAGALISGQHFPYERTVFVMTLVHGIAAVLDETVVGPTGATIFYAIDWTLTLISVLDVVARGLVQGAALGHYCYFSANKENKADVFAVFTSFFAMVLQYSYGALNTWQYFAPPLALKAFRPLRLMVRSKATKSVFYAVWKTVPAMLRVLLLSGAFFVGVAIMCIEAYGGILKTCNDGSDRSLAECTGYWFATTDDNVILPGNATSTFLPREWSNPTLFHFDNIITSFATLTAVSVVSQWTDVLFQVVDAPDVPGGRPLRNNRPIMPMIVFVAWVFFSNFCLLNIFVGTVVDKFTKLKLKMSGSLFLTEEQTEIAHIRKLLHQTGVKKALSLHHTDAFINRALNVMCFKLANNDKFKTAVSAVVLYNLIIIATVRYNQSETLTNVQFWSTIAVSIVFVFEMVVKMGIAGPRAYLAIGFNRIDFFIVVQSVVELVLYLVVPAYAERPQLQIFRLIRVLRIVRDRKSLRRLVHTGYRSLPAMWNIGSLLFLVFYIFSFFAMACFHRVRTVLYDSTGQLLDYNLNFRNFPRSMISLYLVATLDNWGEIMSGAAVNAPYCTAGESCGSTLLARGFFIFFIVAVAFVMINLFIAVVLENFSESVLLPTYMKERMADVNLFRNAWVTYDPAGRQVVHASNFVPLLQALPGPRKRLELLQAKDAADDVSQCSWTQEEMEYYAAHCAVGLEGEQHASIIPTLKQLQVPVTRGRQEVLFADAIDAIGEKIFHVRLVSEHAAHQRAKKMAIEYAWNYQVCDYYCSVIIQRAWREYLKYKYDPNGSPRQRFKRWDAVLGPILQQVWAHHAQGIFGEETAEEAAKLRKLTKGRKRKGAQMGVEEAAAVDGTLADDSPQEQKRHIKQRLTVADALAAKMMAVDEEEKEDESWREAIEDVGSDGSSDPDELDETYWLSENSRRAWKRQQEDALARGDRRHVQFAIPPDYTRPEPFQLLTLSQLIQRRRRHERIYANPQVSAKLSRIHRKERTWQALVPHEEDLAEVVHQAKPLSKNQQILLQQQLAQNPNMDISGVTLEQPARGSEPRSKSRGLAADTSTESAAGTKKGARARGGSARRNAMRNSEMCFDDNDGEIPDLERVIAEMRERRNEPHDVHASSAFAQPVDAASMDGSGGAAPQTRRRANFIMFDGEDDTPADASAGRSPVSGGASPIPQAGSPNPRAPSENTSGGSQSSITLRHRRRNVDSL